jgi:hypothetical protein
MVKVDTLARWPTEPLVVLLEVARVVPFGSYLDSVKEQVVSTVEAGQVVLQLLQHRDGVLTMVVLVVQVLRAVSVGIMV